MKLIDLTGQKFGKLYVIERDFSKKNGTYWKCKCDCGNVCSLRKDVLTRENKPQRSCGCDLPKRNSEAHLKKEIGNKYGKLTVIKRVDNINKGARWLCQCECGNTCEVNGINLRNGSVKSCGCLRREIGQKNGIDETGNIYGKLQVLKRGDRTDGTHIFWLCKCDCGNLVEVNGSYLRSGVSTNCGCERSVGEYKICQLLQANNINYKREYTFSDCLGDSGARLRFDFGILDNENNLLYLIEYDGIQHFKSECFGQSSLEFEKLKKYDKIKTEYCKNNNIPLIRIHYSKLSSLTFEDIYLKEVFL